MRCGVRFQCSRSPSDFSGFKENHAPGDVVEIEVDAIGILRNGIRDEA
jgi:2-keto-4-pentenoate hydratase/2-oxohepta-3-ene-1,7-dioic acid hydratase in catechol pathway